MRVGSNFVDRVLLGSNESFRIYNTNKLVFPAIKFNRDFAFGVNGHQMTFGKYYSQASTNFPWQIQRIKEAGLTWTRMDVISDVNGVILNTQALNYRWGRLFGTSAADIGSPANADLAQNFGWYFKCQAEGIQVLPMLSVRAGGTDIEDNHWTALYPDTTAAYNAGYTQAFGFLTNYGQYFTHIELGNELELFTKLLLPGTVGNTEASYKMDKTNLAVAYIQGMEAGAKAAKPTIITMFNIAGWLAVYLLDRVLAAAPTINKIGWHWYSGHQTSIHSSTIGNRLPGDGKSPYAGNYTDLPSYLANRYPGKGIWITEMGNRYSESLSKGQNEKNTIDIMNSMFTDFLPAPNIEMMFFHELIDSTVGETFSAEQHFGLNDSQDSQVPIKKAIQLALENKGA